MGQLMMYYFDTAICMLANFGASSYLNQLSNAACKWPTFSSFSYILTKFFKIEPANFVLEFPSLAIALCWHSPPQIFLADYIWRRSSLTLPRVAFLCCPPDQRPVLSLWFTDWNLSVNHPKPSLKVANVVFKKIRDVSWWISKLASSNNKYLLRFSSFARYLEILARFLALFSIYLSLDCEWLSLSCWFLTKFYVIFCHVFDPSIRFAFMICFLCQIFALCFTFIDRFRSLIRKIRRYWHFFTWK